MKFQFVCLAVIAGSGVAVAAIAQERYPDRPLRLIVPYPAGGTVDTIAREVTAPGILGQQAVVDNRPGANGIIGADLVAKAPANGYTMMLHSISHAINASLYGKLPYNTASDFVAVTTLVEQPNMLVVHPGTPADSVKALIALAKAKPGTLTFVSPGSGSSPHLTGELFKSMAQVDILHVPYRGGPAAMNDLMGGRVTMSFQSVFFSMPLVKSGKLKALAVTSASRSKSAPEIPTVAETIPGFESGTWYGLFLPAGTPLKIVGQLNGEIVKNLRNPQVRERLTASGAEIVGDTPAQFAARVKGDMEKWGRIVAASGARID